MNTQTKKWEILGETKKDKSKLNTDDIVHVLLKNRGIETSKEKEEFFHPTPPSKISLRSLGIKTAEVKKAINRIQKAIKNKEKIIIYGDYDADGITGTAILWECLHKLGANVSPYIPERFSEGYGLNPESITKLKKENPDLNLIISVDNGIVANKAVNVANKLGIDVIITDHHQRERKDPKALAIIHTTKISGSGVAWIFSRELKKKTGLELAAIGTIADQSPLIGPNRSFVKYGLKALNKTTRPGLLSLFKQAGLKKDLINIYVVGFIIAPRINAMGRLEHAIDSLRLLCTKNRQQAKELASLLGKTNSRRQKIVKEVVVHAREATKECLSERVIFIAHESYHEGVIGLAASRLVEEFCRPVIVLSQGEKFSKASARSMPGFNIIEAIKSAEDLLVSVGGHPMAAGFTIETNKMEKFFEKLKRKTSRLLTDDLLVKRLEVDLELDFDPLNSKLANVISAFEPTGIGNPAPTFATKNVSVIDTRIVGKNGGHLKLKLKKDEKIFDAIAFGFAEPFGNLTLGDSVDIVYNLEINSWQGRKTLQLKIKDMCEGVED